MAAIVEVSGLSKVFTSKDGHVHALTDINLSVEEGSIFGIIGMSGAGKSTLVRCFNFLERPTEGEVRVDGRLLDTLSRKELLALRTEIGMIFQNFNLLMQKNVLENVILPLRIKGRKRQDCVDRARELLKIVGLEEKERSYPSQLSGGQMQRVAIARALANRPRILLCDEATSALDPQTTKSILELIRRINKEFGITVIIITHAMSVVREVCDTVAVIEKGRLVQVGEVEEVMADVE
ncbi:MAG: ATP-binding cassette domain-containing protein [Lachnospiraceae bacterium]|nr:ATP-binding cassette domain-containing protein [Lachnospiraceae bacterium]